MFDYDSKDAATAWEEGQYPATFIGAEDGVSKTSGQPMQTWTFEVYDNLRDRKQTIKDYVTKAALFKVRQLAGALNKAAEFKANRFFPEDYVGSAVMVELVIEPGKDGYEDKNKIGKVTAKPPATPGEKSAAQTILDTKPRHAAAVAAADAGNGAIKDEDIPF